MTAQALASKLGLVQVKIYEGTFEKLGTTFHQLSARTLEGKMLNFSHFHDKIVLITNVASHCGSTNKNYTQLVALDKDYGGKLQIMAFPSNQFGAQEPYSCTEIRKFVDKFGVKFHMMEKVQVNGPATHPVFQALKKATGSEDADIGWNFETRFLVHRNGIDVARFSKAFDPGQLVPFIDTLLDQPTTPIKTDCSFVASG